MNIDLRLHIRSAVAFMLMMVAVTLVGCSEDLPTVGTSPAQQGVTLMIPTAPQFVGAQDNSSNNATATADELRYTSLIFFAFPQEGKGETCVIPLSTNPNNMSVKDAYREYEIPLKKGTYRFFLVANYFGNDEEPFPTSEESLLAKLLEYDDQFDGSLPENGLPMSAAHDDFRQEKSGEYFSRSFEYDGEGTTLYADMTFACAKITLEVKNFEGDAAEIKELTLDNFSKQVPLIFKEGYQEWYGKIESKNLSVTHLINSDHSISFYVPERYVDKGKKADQSMLQFKVALSMANSDIKRDISLPLGEKVTTGTDNSSAHSDTYLKVPKEDDLRELRRGTHYIYLLNPLAEMSLKIEDWTPVKLAYELLGPVYLHVEQQSYRITAGETTAVWYDSDVKEVYVESPTYTPAGSTVPIPLYKTKVGTDTIRIWVNEDIKATWYEDIKAEPEKYDFFHIVAGPIHKRIMVDPLTLDYYLYVTPTEIPVNARIRIASGEYAGSIPVEIHTNYPYLKIKREDGWGSTLLQGDNSGLLTLTDQEGEDIGKNYSFQETTDNIKNLSVNFDGLNSGKEFWRKSSELNFTVQGRRPTEDGDVFTEEIPVRIFTTPNVLDYKIHFYADGWSSPHIYVYQCLEFPGVWNQTYAGQSLASKPIGYQQSESYLASLEYSFTGKIAFKGWDDPVNYSALYNDNGSMKEFVGDFKRGFYIFNDNTGSWRIDDRNNQTIIRYNFDMDFCKAHREEIKDLCKQCASETEYAKVFPGIQMKKEADGWWSLELTGVAVPGRSLILFADGHNKGWSRRFPAETSGAGDGDVAPVGLTLFDYPDREGWLWFNGDANDRINNVFEPEKPNFADNMVTYRLYWPKRFYKNSMEYDIPGIWMWLLDRSGNFIRNLVPGEFNTTLTLGTPSGEYYYYDFSLASNLRGKIGLLLRDRNSWATMIEYSVNWDLSLFTLGEDGIKSAYINPYNYLDKDNATLNPGVPPSN